MAPYTTLPYARASKAHRPTPTLLLPYARRGGPTTTAASARSRKAKDGRDPPPPQVLLRTLRARDAKRLAAAGADVGARLRPVEARAERIWHGAEARRRGRSAPWRTREGEGLRDLSGETYSHKSLRNSRNSNRASPRRAPKLVFYKLSRNARCEKASVRSELL